MTKALMVNTATDWPAAPTAPAAPTRNVPTQVQGWGRMNLRTVARRHRAPVRRPELQVDGDAASASAPLRRRHTAQAAASVTLAWTDAAGPDDRQRLRQRPRPRGARRRPRPTRATCFAGGALGPRRHRRPAQQRRERLPAGRRRAARSRSGCRGTNIAGDGVPGNADTTDQDYALVVSNAGAGQPPAPVLTTGNTDRHDRRRRRRLHRARRAVHAGRSDCATSATPRRRGSRRSLAAAPASRSHSRTRPYGRTSRSTRSRQQRDRRSASARRTPASLRRDRSTLKIGIDPSAGARRSRSPCRRRGPGRAR